MKKIILTCIISFLFINCNQKKKTTKEDKKQEILVLEQKRVDALLKNDIDVLESMMHPKAVHISSNGSRKTKEEWVEGRKNATNSFKTFVLNKDYKIRLFKNTAIIDGSYTNSKLIDSVETPIKHARYTRVYSKINHDWVLVSHQATETQKP